MANQGSSGPEPPKKNSKKFHPDLKAGNFPTRKSFLHITKTQQAKHRRLQQPGLNIRETKGSISTLSSSLFLKEKTLSTTLIIPRFEMPGIVQQPVAVQSAQPATVVQLKQAHKEQGYVSLIKTHSNLVAYLPSLLLP
jgi:hypothetical protein